LLHCVISHNIFRMKRSRKDKTTEIKPLQLFAIRATLETLTSSNLKIFIKEATQLLRVQQAWKKFPEILKPYQSHFKFENNNNDFTLQLTNTGEKLPVSISYDPRAGKYYNPVEDFEFSIGPLQGRFYYNLGVNDLELEGLYELREVFKKEFGNLSDSPIIECLDWAINWNSRNIPSAVKYIKNTLEKLWKEQSEDGKKKIYLRKV